MSEEPPTTTVAFYDPNLGDMTNGEVTQHYLGAQLGRYDEVASSFSKSGRYGGLYVRLYMRRHILGASPMHENLFLKVRRDGDPSSFDNKPFIRLKFCENHAIRHIKEELFPANLTYSKGAVFKSLVDYGYPFTKGENVTICDHAKEMLRLVPDCYLMDALSLQIQESLSMTIKDANQVKYKVYVQLKHYPTSCQNYQNIPACSIMVMRETPTTSSGYGGYTDTVNAEVVYLDEFGELSKKTLKRKIGIIAKQLFEQGSGHAIFKTETKDLKDSTGATVGYATFGIESAEMKPVPKIELKRRKRGVSIVDPPTEEEQTREQRRLEALHTRKVRVAAVGLEAALNKAGYSGSKQQFCEVHGLDKKVIEAMVNVVIECYSETK